MMMRLVNWTRNPSGKTTMNFSRSQSLLQLIFCALLASHYSFILATGCQFYPVGEYLRFVRIPEDLRIGDRVMTVEVRQRHNLTLESIDKGEDAKFFTFTEINEDTVEIRLARSLEHIADNDRPQNILKFRLVCYPAEEHEATPSFLSVTVYVEDINNRKPSFVHAPYYISVDELTPVGLTIFRGISAVDLDKPNTANSDIHFSLVEGNDDGKFGLESSHRPALVIKKSLDYDAGDHDFHLVIMASDRGNPPLSSSTTVHLTVIDNDDLPPIFTKSIYRTQIKESYPISNDSVRQEIIFPSPISAFDQDLAINATIQYDLISGNEMKYFEINSSNATLYLIKDIDREALNSNIFDLQIRARQVDDPSKFGLAKVELSVIDINDQLPAFEVDVYNISIMENLPNGFSVVQVYARDLDQGENAEFTYKLDERTSPFAIDPKSGWLTVRDQAQLDREKVESIKLRVVAEEKVTNVANPGVKSHARLVIYLLDSNDNSPRWIPSNLYKFQVTLDSEIGSVVGKIMAEDPDLGANGRVMYDLQKSNGSIEDLPFEIDSKTGYIFLLERPLPKLQYTLLVEASDQPLNPSERRFSLAVVQIDVVKAGANHSPEFIGSPYEFWVGTQVGIGTSVGQVKVKDLDPKYTVYDLLHSYYEGVPFAIEERTGIIAVVDELIKYPRHQYDFEAYVTDSRHTLTTNVSIHIVDPIDGAADGGNADPIELFVSENVAGAVVANLRKEFGPNGKNRDTSAMEFLLANFDARDKFAISTDGTIYTLKGLDREEKARHLLTVISQSRGVIQGQGVYQIFVNVKDENDNPPSFDQKNYEGQVRENSNPGTPVLMDIPVKVNDPDEGSNAKFRIELTGNGADRFRVDPLSGKLYVGNIPLDREEKQLYSLELVATDSGNLSSKVPLSILIQDQNDNAPIFFQNIVLDPPDLDQTTGPRELLRSSASQPVSVEISNTEPIVIPETISVGTRIARVLATDRDMGDNSKIFYRIVSENSNMIGEKFSFLTDKQYLFNRNKEKHFVIDRLTGEISVAKPLKPDTEYGLNITASDRGGLRTYTGVKVVVVDINNHIPVFSKPWYTFEVLEGIFAHQQIGKISAKDGDGDSGINGQIAYSLQEKNKSVAGKLPFMIDSRTGHLFADGDLDREKRARYNFQILATDKGSPPMQSVVEIDIHILDINDNKPVFFNFMNTAKFSDNVIPIYRTSTKDDIPVGSLVAQVYANDTDNPSNGNGLVLFHLNNNHKEFYIDSKNGSIFTLSHLDFDAQNEYNITVVASDLGEPSLSSTAWMLIRVLDSRGAQNQTKERRFDKEVYTFQVKRDVAYPFSLIRFNVTEKFKRYPSEFEIVGEESVISKFRVEPTTGKLFITKGLDYGKTYEFLIRSQNRRQTKGFDTRQASKVTERFLEPNEALVRVTVAPEPIKLIPPIPPSAKKRNQTSKIELASSTTPVSTHTTSSPKEGPRIIHGYTHPTRRPINSTADTERTANQKHGQFYIGEIAVLSLSAVIFIGGLIAAISVACVRRKRRHRRRLPHMATMPLEVRLQKQMALKRCLGNPSARPVLFPMALPGDPVMSEGTSDGTSDTYTDSPEMMRDGHTHSNRLSYNLKANGYSICPDCQKLKKPGRFVNPKIGTDPRDHGPLKQYRAVGIREISLPSSNDSGIDGSDGQCTCCHSHNSSSDSGRSAFMEREQYEDSLMPQLAVKPKSFRRKRTSQNKQFVGNITHASSGKHNPHGFARRLDNGVVML